MKVKQHLSHQSARPRASLWPLLITAVESPVAGLLLLVAGRVFGGGRSRRSHHFLRSNMISRFFFCCFSVVKFELIQVCIQYNNNSTQASSGATIISLVSTIRKKNQQKIIALKSIFVFEKHLRVDCHVFAGVGRASERRTG